METVAVVALAATRAIVSTSPGPVRPLDLRSMTSFLQRPIMSWLPRLRLGEDLLNDGVWNTLIEDDLATGLAEQLRELHDPGILEQQQRFR